MENNTDDQIKEAAKKKLLEYKKQMQNEGRLPKDGEKPEPIDQYKSYY